MHDAVLGLTAAVGRGTVHELAQAAAECCVAAWLAEDVGWRPFGRAPSDAPEEDDTLIEGLAHKVALRGADAGTIALVEAGLIRIDAEAARQAAQSRLDMNERIAGIGSYDWEIGSDNNVWSDELYRIYGHEPGSFNASYEKFMSMVHPDDREHTRSVHQQALDSSKPYEMEERIVRPDGSVRTLWSHGVVLRDAEGSPSRMLGICRDVTDEREAEKNATEQHDRIHKAELLRKQALDVNDNIVQGLTAAVWALETDAPLVARKLAAETLQHARAMMHELLSASDDPTSAGSLVREGPAVIAQGSVAAHEDVPGEPPATRTEPPTGRCRVVLADDAEDLRTLLRMSLIKWAPKIDVVGEAGDGVEAVEVVARLQPDVILLDLSMPRMDGLEACARIKQETPGTRVVVLTGWGEETLGSQAREAGADAFIQKGASIEAIILMVEEQRALAPR